MPLTIHTSPFQVQMAARCPPLKKSKPPKRIQVCHGFSASGGGVISSTANGPLSSPSLPRVARGGFQRAGPPLVGAVRAAAGDDANAGADSVAVFVPGFARAISSFTFNGVADAGMRKRLKPFVM